MEGIRVVSKTIVRPQNFFGEQFEKVELTPWDLKCLLMGPVQKGLFFPKPSLLQKKELFANNVVEHLKNSFARVLQFFYPLSGRLGVVQYDDNMSSFFINCNNRGAEFFHTIVDNVMIKDILEPIYTPQIVQDFFPLNKILNINASNPLLAVQVNELGDGIFIGCTMNRVVADDTSFWYFFDSWSEISRGFDTISKLPIFKRWFPRNIVSPIRIPSSVCEVRQSEFSLPLYEESVFHFPKENIERLKAKANLETNTTNISSLQALLAHLWQSMIRSQKIYHDIEVTYVLVVSARTTLKRFIPENYFGNAVHGIPLVSKAGFLAEQSLGNISCRMIQLCDLHTGDEFVKDITEWAKNPKLFRLSGFEYGVLTSSLPRFSSFGWGKSVGMRCGLANKCEDKVSLFPGIEEGSIDIVVCSSLGKLNALRNDPVFMEGVRNYMVRL